jgi:hypothetical protein
MAEVFKSVKTESVPEWFVRMAERSSSIPQYLKVEFGAKAKELLRSI